jgi:hypothetical protein
MLDERFVMDDWDLDDDDLIPGTCAECGRYERLLHFLNADMLCPKCAAQQSVQADGATLCEHGKGHCQCDNTRCRNYCD